MTRDQVMQALADKLRELDLDEGMVGMVAITSTFQAGTRICGFDTASQFSAIAYAQLVLEVACAVKKKVGEL